MIDKTTLAQHIEYGLTHIADRIYQIHSEVKDRELETISLGLFPDEEKLKHLKADLYRKARSRGDSQDIQNLTIAIATISNQLEAERNHRNSPVEQIYGILNSIILLGFLTTTLSFPATWTCNVFKNQSQACQVSRVIPNKVFQFFTDPK